MYFVSAPTVARGGQKSQGADTAQHHESRHDLRLVEPGHEAPDALPPSEIAARILQLHAASQGQVPTRARQPRIRGDVDDTSFEIPGVFKRERDEIEAAAPDPLDLRPAQLDPERARAMRSGPSFRALMISTLLIASAGGGALALGLARSLPGADTGEPVIRTGLITPEPTIETIIADTQTPGTAEPKTGNVSGAGAARPADTPPASSPDKRIRQMFAGRDASVTTGFADSFSNTSDSAAANEPRPGKDRADSAERSPAPAATAPARLPAATIAARAPVADVSGVDRGTNSSAPVPSAPVLSTPVVSDPAPGAGVPDNVAAMYPNTGRTLVAVNMRQAEDKDAPIITVIPADAEIRFNTCGTWWCGAHYQGQDGFVGQKYLDRTQQPD